MGKNLRVWLCVLLVMGIALSMVLLTGCTKPKQAAVDYEALAEKMVNQCAQIKEGDCVLITGGVKNMELMEDLAVHVRKAGAFPMITIDSDRMDRRMITEVPEKWDTQRPIFAENFYSLVSAIFSVSYREKLDLYSDIPAKRLETLIRTYTPIFDLYTKRRIREISLGNGLYPTADLARLFGMPLDTLSKLFWNGVNIDYNKLHASCEAVKAVLAGGKEIRITHANGTDLTFGVKGRLVTYSDGIIPPDNPKLKKALLWADLPAGEVVVTPVPGTAKGKVVVERHFYQGKEIKGMSLTFSSGKVSSIYGGIGGEAFLEMYNASGEGKDLFGSIDIGTNPNVRIPADSRMVAYMPSGSVTIGLGKNDFLGGENTGSFGFAFFLPGYTVTVDGKVLVENGVLKI